MKKLTNIQIFAYDNLNDSYLFNYLPIKAKDYANLQLIIKCILPISKLAATLLVLIYFLVQLY